MGTARGRIMIEYDENGTRRFSEDMERAQRQSRSARDVFSSTADTMAKGGLIIAGGFALAVKSAADFDKRLSAIKAVSGATNNEMEQLRQKALQLGADTKFSASEAASAMEELVKAGISTKDVLGGAADAAVALAAAGEVDLKTAAELAANAMNAFALSAKDLPRVADLIAGAANASAIDVGEFGQSLKQVGAVAHLAGLSFKDTAVAIAIMGNAGIKGSDAGTSLKTMLQNLVPHSSKAAGLMKELGIITKGAGNRFFDMKGNVKDLAGISQVLQDALAGMSKEEKLAALNTLFGSDAIRGAAILSEQGAKGFNKMADSMTKIKAADVAKTRMDNLSGSIEQLKGSLETAFIQMGSGSQGPLRSLVDGLTKAVNWFTDLSDGTKQWILVATLAVGAFLLVGAAIIKTVLFFQKLAAAIRVIAGLRAVQTVLLNLRGVLFVVNGALRNFVAAMGRAALAGARAAAAGIRQAAVAMGRLALAAGRAALAMARQAARAAAQAALSLGRLALNAARAAASMAVVAARGTALAAANFASTLAAGARSMALMAVNGARAAATMTLMAARVLIVNAAMAAARLATLAWAAAMFLLNAATGPIGLIIIAVIALVAAVVLLWKRSETFRNIVIGIWNAVKSAIVAAVKFVVNFVKNHWQLLIAIILGPMGIIIGLVIKYWRQIRDFITGVVSGVINFVRTHWKAIIAVIAGPLGILIGLIIKYRNQILNVFRRLPGQIIGFFRGAGRWLWNAGRDIIQGLLNGIASMFRKLQGMLNSVTRVIPDWKGPPEKDAKLLTKSGELIMSGLIKGFQNYLPEVRAALRLVTTNMVTSTVAGIPSTYEYLPNGQAYIPQGQGNLLPRGVEMEELATHMANALRKAGLGTVTLDGQVVSQAVSKVQGRTTSYQRRTR